MQNFADSLFNSIRAKGSPICVGLDPRLDRLPSFIQEAAKASKGKSFEAVAEAFFTFNKGIIDAVYDLVPVVKPQFAFYLQYGFAGVRAFEETCKYAQEKGLLVIADAKSNDIGTTAEAYANWFLGEVDVFGKKVGATHCDALTVNAYLGYDGVKPFIDVCKKQGKGIFVLVKTSNHSSGDLQDRVNSEDVTNYELMGHFVESWGADEIGKSGFSSVGAVVGATFPAEARKLREIMTHSYFLVPGFGAQGAKAADVAAAFTKQGTGAIVNSSREIIFAWEKEGSEREYGAAARRAVEKMKKELAEVL